MAKRKAFTLIELLVVVSIIALLVSILMPALGKARQQAKLLSCMVNSKQVGYVASLYQADNEEYVPLITSIAFSSFQPAEKVYTSLGLRGYADISLPDHLDPFAIWPYGGVDGNEYLNSYIPDYFVCPFVRDKEVATGLWQGGQANIGGQIYPTASRDEAYETFAVWINDVVAGSDTIGGAALQVHPYGPPHGRPKYGALTWFKKLGPAGEPVGSRKWTSAAARNVGTSSLSEVSVLHCAAGEYLAGGAQYIYGYNGGHIKGDSAGTVLVFADTHVEWVIGSQVIFN